MSADSLRSWIEQQSSRLKLPDINLLLDTYLTSPSDDEIISITTGLLGDSPEIQSFLKELCNRRSKANISMNEDKTPQTNPQGTTDDHPTGLFFTDEDVDIMDLAQLFHVDKPQDSKVKESFPTLEKQTQPKDQPKKVNNKTIASTSMILAKDNKSIEYINAIPVSQKRKKQQSTTDSQAKSQNASHAETKAPIPPTSSGTPQQHFVSPSSVQDNIQIHASRGSQRQRCGCMAATHDFYGNCTQCGLIYCVIEGEGECFYCGSYLINFDLNKQLIARYSKQKTSSTTGHDKNKGQGKTNKKKEIQVFHETQKASGLSSSTSELSAVIDHELIDVKHVNIEGNGLVCIPNQTFIDYMSRIIKTAVGVNFIHKQQQSADIDTQLTPTHIDHTSDANRESSIAIRNQSAYGQQRAVPGGGLSTHADQEAHGLAKAIEFRNTLLQRANEKAQRTRVIDEQSDYYEYENNIWLSDGEKQEQAELAKFIEDTIEDEHQTNYMSLDIDSAGKVNVKYDRVDRTFQGVGAVGQATEEIREKASQALQAKRNLENAPPLADASNAATVVADDSKLVAGSAVPLRTLLRSVDLPLLQQRAGQTQGDTEPSSSSKKKKKKKAAIHPEHSTDEITNGSAAIETQTSPSQLTSTSLQQVKASLTPSHLSGRALLVFQTLQRTLKAVESQGLSSSSTLTQSTAWSTPLQSVLIDSDDDDSDEYNAMVASLESALHTLDETPSPHDDITPLNLDAIQDTQEQDAALRPLGATSSNAIPLYPSGGFELESAAEPGCG